MGRHHENQPDAHVEHPKHLGTVNLPHPAQGLKEGGNRPGLSVDPGTAAIRQHTRQILGNAPARDVGNAFNGKFPQEGENLFREGARRVGAN